MTPFVSKKGSERFYWGPLDLRGLPRGRMVRSKSSFCAKSSTHCGLPYGRPVAFDRRMDAKVLSGSG